MREECADFSSTATASYLATIHNKEQVYHISSSPLSYELFPNVYPMAILPTANKIFSAAYSLSMASHVTGRDLPVVIKSVRQCLKQGASFHITLIDPMPVASSVGPYMRGWLFKHLNPYIEEKKRCMYPVREVPTYLGESLLRGKGSTIQTAKFLAIFPGHTGILLKPDGSVVDWALKAELRSVIGRMLWMEVWGRHVKAEKWWWEDPDIVKECIQLNTFWEYRVIEAVRED